MGTRSFVENHPASVIGSIVVATVASTFAVVHFLYSAIHEADMATAVAQQEHLRDRLQSIDRGIPQDPYFDVTDLIIRREHLSTLATSFESFRGGKFFVDVPDFGDWPHERTTEGAFALRRMGLPEGVLPELFEVPIDVWQDGSAEELRVPVPGMEGLSVTYVPTVAVQVLSAEQVLGAMYAMEKELSANALLNGLLEGLLGEDVEQFDEPLPSALGVEESNAALEQMHKVMFDDISGFLLMSTLLTEYSRTQLLPNARVRVLSVEKKGNVFYGRTMSSFDVSDGTLEEATAVVNREYFVIGGDEAAIAVQIEVPSAVGQAEAFQWTSAWLLGLRVPVGAMALD